MTEKYDGNGDFSPYNDDENEYSGKPRKTAGSGGGPGSGPGAHNGDSSVHDHSHHGGDGNGSVQINEKANEYIRDCMAERNRMDRKFPIGEKLLDGEIEKVQTTGRIPSREQKYADIYREKPLRISQRVLVPIREHPKFNFVGKLLGPKGNSLRRLQEETLCKMTVLGRNSMRDRVKEEELRNSKDPKYAHLNSDLHVEISTIAPPAEAYARIAYAMAELRKYLIPDSNDIIRQEQLRELMDSTSLNDNDNAKSGYKKPPHMPSGNNLMSGGPANTAGGPKNTAHHTYRGSQQSSFSKNVLAPKQKVMSILEKARTAMDETYGGYDDGIGYDPHQSYESYSYGSHGHGPPTSILGGVGSINSGGGGRGGGGGGHYDNTDYEPEYGRRDYYQHSPSYTAGGGGGGGGGGHGSGGGGGGSQSNAIGSTGLSSNHNRSHVNR
ncbi:KH domain-containing, RNA-binding, signal transduction-associated protein 2 isoform X3 [Drosophila subobscura]|uniref:KH domain-containing, RNA-binding, signal transduction-associated protein 2 isoform X3 n=1 Tax=Drosophila subobscura TaxID=7241 RepID=UPI00155A898B|nr:KH domain-containing, RNA-binding, signal transduction-associated protein 2 isoform X3 [Drosophila subobscura]